MVLNEVDECGHGKSKGKMRTRPVFKWAKGELKRK